MQLSKVTYNTFEQGKPMDPGFWKESDIDYGAIRQWAEQGFPCGKGFTEPVRHICLDSPETAAEKVYSKIDKKLKQKREKKQNLANPANWLVQAEPSDMEQIDQRWHLPADYRDFLLKASPVYFGLHGMGQWEFSEAFGNFMDFLKHIMVVGK